MATSRPASSGVVIKGRSTPMSGISAAGFDRWPKDSDSSDGRVGVLVEQRWPALRCPVRPCRVLSWRRWNLRTVQFVVIRRLELRPPLLELDVAHVEGLIRGLSRTES